MCSTKGFISYIVVITFIIFAICYSKFSFEGINNYNIERGSDMQYHFDRFAESLVRCGGANC